MQLVSGATSACESPDAQSHLTQQILGRPTPAGAPVPRGGPGSRGHATLRFSGEPLGSGHVGARSLCLPEQRFRTCLVLPQHTVRDTDIPTPRMPGYT